MPRKTCADETVGRRSLGFNEAAARCRGKRHARSAAVSGPAKLQ